MLSGTKVGLGDSTHGLVGVTTTPLDPGPAVPEATVGDNIFAHLTAEDPTGPSQSGLSSEYGPGL